MVHPGRNRLCSDTILPVWSFHIQYTKFQSQLFKKYLKSTYDFFFLLFKCNTCQQLYFIRAGVVPISIFSFIYLFFSGLYFSEQFQVHSKIVQKIQRFSITPCAHTHTIINIPRQSGTFVTTDEPKLTHHNHSKSIDYIRVYSWCCTFFGF